MSRSVLLKTKSVSDKHRRENQNTHFMINIFFCENHSVYMMMWKNFEEPDRPQTTIWRMRIAVWIPKATNTDSEYIMLIDFPLQQWLHESAPMLCYTYIACLVL